MAKKNLKTAFLLSLTLFTVSSCINITPTYKRNNIEKAVKQICSEEYGLDVNVQEVKDTIWVCAPFDNLIDKSGGYDKEILKKVGEITFSLRRVLLSIDKPPKFYVFAASDIKDVGVDLIIAGFIPDLAKLQLQFISRGEFLKRRYVNLVSNKEALGDKTGRHIKKTSLTMPEFIGLLIKQDILNTFLYSKKWSPYWTVKNCDVNFAQQSKNFYIKTDIQRKGYNSYSPRPFEQALKSAQHYLCETYKFKDFSYLKVEDSESGKIKILNWQALSKM